MLKKSVFFLCKVKTSYEQFLIFLSFMNSFSQAEHVFKHIFRTYFRSFKIGVLKNFAIF